MWADQRQAHIIDRHRLLGHHTAVISHAYHNTYYRYIQYRAQLNLNVYIQNVYYMHIGKSARAQQYNIIIPI